jgi:DNA modification methylase
MVSSTDLLDEFRDVLRLQFTPDRKLLEQTERLLEALGAQRRRVPRDRRRYLLAHVNEKFRFNAERIAAFLGEAAKDGVTFNYHEKNDIAFAFDLCDAPKLESLLQALPKLSGRGDLINQLMQMFDAQSAETTLRRLHDELRSPTLTRKDSKPRDWSSEILSSLLAAHVCSSFPRSAIHAAFDPLREGQHYEDDFWGYLHKNFPKLFSRENTLTVIKASVPELNAGKGYETFREEILALISRAYPAIANHGHLALLLDASAPEARGLMWQLFGDTVLYAEKHLAFPLRQSFFRANDIAAATQRYIASLDPELANFEELYHGFSYLDCFVLGDGPEQRLLVLFQKHEADETLIPCPACRSRDVQGNSYSSLGIRSWECNNLLCPDRSKFNRGKRYSFLQLLKQQAIQDPEAEIPAISVRQWMKDVQPARSDAEVLQMLVRHYSLQGDSVWLVGLAAEELPNTGRRLENKTIQAIQSLPHDSRAIAPDRFFESSYFRRFIIDRPLDGGRTSHLSQREALTTAFLGDSFEVLASLPANSIDGAVTSPPYYNAREYSQWPNIYTYLYDMYNITRQVFRVLRPGALYLFNIFDYFDNENNVSLSAMGEKRMILGAYTLDFLRRAGFVCRGNVVWDKGDIEGKRGFNNGNFSPYYQAPFNCWEHIFVFQKPAVGQIDELRFPQILRQKPVIKMIRGTNTHGHTAPYPAAIPQLLTSQLAPGSTVLDPFAGSMTTAIAAEASGIGCYCIEKNREYFDLGLQRLRANDSRQILL